MKSSVCCIISQSNTFGKGQQHQLILLVLQDYVAIMEFLMKHWKIESLGGLNSPAQKAQEDVQALLTKFKRLTDRQVTCCLAQYTFVCEFQPTRGIRCRM